MAFGFQVKIDELVKPEKAVADYRSEITGLTADDLVGVTCSLAEIQVRSGLFFWASDVLLSCLKLLTLFL